MKLQVLISTCNSLEKVSAMTLPEVREVGYLIVCQSEPGYLPENLKRADIQVHFISGRGLSRNRNEALRLATAPYVLIADDDLELFGEGLSKVIDAFDRNPEISVATFVCQGLKKKYPATEWPLEKKFKGYLPSSVEIAINLEESKSVGLRFNETMGAGTDELLCGEEDIFLLNACRLGMKGRFFPVAVCSHPHESTGERLQSASGVLKAQGVVMALKYPCTAIPRILLKAKRTRGNILRNAWYLLAGACYGACNSRKFLIAKRK